MRSLSGEGSLPSSASGFIAAEAISASGLKVEGRIVLLDDGDIAVIMSMDFA